MIFALYEHPDGVETKPGNRVVFDLEGEEAWVGAARVDGPALVFELRGASNDLVTDRYKEGAALVARVALDSATDWIARCDRVDFPPGGVAYRHVHPGPGIRRLLFGALAIEAAESMHTYGPGEPWFEDADYPVRATASASTETAFVRVLLLPTAWAGKRTIRYLDPADEEKPRLQRATILLEAAIEL